MELIIYPNKILKEKSTPVEFGVDLSMEIDEMKKIMLKNKGIGLSAIQVGIPKTFFIMDSSFMKNNLEVVINPIIDYRSNNTEILEEGCLSFPNKFIQKKRHKLIHVEYYNEKWEKITCYYSGIKARIFQHEYDHLIGKCII